MLSTHPLTVVQETPEATWTISHGLGCRPTVSVKVYEKGVLTEILPVSVSFPDLKTIVIEFSSPRYGEVRLA